MSLSHLKRFLGVLAYSLIILACVFISHETQQKQGLADSPGFGLNHVSFPVNPENDPSQSKTKAIVDTMANHAKPILEAQKNLKPQNAKNDSHPPKGIPVLMGQSFGIVPTGLGQSQL